MKVTETMLHNWGVKDLAMQKKLMESLNGETSYVEELEKKVNDLIADLQQEKKMAAVEKAIWEAGGKNAKAILALIDLAQVTYDEKTGLQGLDLEAVQEEAPYLFHEKTEKKQGTGTAKSGLSRKETEIREAFRRGLGR